MEIKTPNYTETLPPSAPPAEGNQPLPVAISDATKYLLQVLDPVGARVGSQDLSQLSLEGLGEILDKTEALLAKLMPSAPPLDRETPAKPIPSAPPLPPPEPNQAPNQVSPALAAPAARFAMAGPLNPNTNFATQRAFTGISLPANPPVAALGKTALTNPRSSGSLGGNVIETLSKESSQHTKKPNTFSSTSEQAHSTSTKSAQKEPFLQNATLADAAVENESMGAAFSETVSLSAETLANGERGEPIVIQTEETVETQASQERSAGIESAIIFVSEKRTVDALIIEQTAQESKKESAEESALSINEEKELARAEQQEGRSMLEEISSSKISRSSSKELFFSTNSPFAQERSAQNQLDERSPLAQNSRPFATLPNPLKSLEHGANPLQSPASEKRAPPSEIAQESSLPSAIKSQAPSSQMLSPLNAQTKVQTPSPSSTRQILTALKSSQELIELSLEQNAITLSPALAQSSNNTLIVPYSTVSPIQSSSPSKTAGTGSLQPVAEFSDEDFDEEEDEEDEEEDEEDDLFEDLKKQY